MPKCGGNKYLLVLVCTYSGWVEVYPTRTDKAREVIPCFSKISSLGFGLPLQIRSDNRPAFVSDLVQKIAKILGITWKLHAAYWPQRSRKVGQMNLTIKNSSRKVCQETCLNWVQTLPMVLFKIRCTPAKRMGYSSYGILYHRPPPILLWLPGTPWELGEIELQQQLQALGKVMKHAPLAYFPQLTLSP